jgi:hypothetical protein
MPDRPQRQVTLRQQTVCTLRAVLDFHGAWESHVGRALSLQRPHAWANNDVASCIFLQRPPVEPSSIITFNRYPATWIAWNRFLRPKSRPSSIVLNPCATVVRLASIECSIRSFVCNVLYRGTSVAYCVSDASSRPFGVGLLWFQNTPSKSWSPIKGFTVSD